jgi:superfamily II DNA/RNA helicase
VAKAAVATPFQMLLFSATMPAFVASVAKKYMRPDRVLVDMIGGAQNRTSEG